MDQDQGVLGCLDDVHAGPRVPREHELPAVLGLQLQAKGVCAVVHREAFQLADSQAGKGRVLGRLVRLLLVSEGV